MSELERRAAELGPEPAACPVCTSPSPDKLFFRDEKWFWSCGNCELQWVHDIYPEFVTAVDYLDEPTRYDPNRGPKPSQLTDYARLLKSFEPYHSSDRDRGRLLEVGCSVGLFLATARDAGWDTAGVEILPEPAEAARADRGLDVHTGDLIEARFPDAAFDIVYSNEVIEHVVDPLELMREVARVLRPGGLAVIRTGNARSWSARLRGKGWQYYHFGGHDHIRYWSPRAGRALAEATGFELLAAQTRGFAFRESREMRGRWYKPLVTIAQALVSPIAGPVGAGHRLTLRMRRL
jgi:SAM-dependent methyltransferase